MGATITSVLVAPPPPASSLQTGLRMALGAGLIAAGASHLAWARDEFLAQVPDWVPLDAALVVVLSGVVEIVAGLALVALGRHRVVVGLAVAAFFVAIFPGNISQFVDGDDAFGLESDLARAARLAFQPLLVAWALWSTGAWDAWRSWRADREPGP